MNLKTLSPQALRACTVGAGAILLAVICGVTAMLMGGAERPAGQPIQGSESETDRPIPSTRPPSQKPTPGDPETDAPVYVPDTVSPLPDTPTIAPIVWHLPLDRCTLSKGHDLTKQVYSTTMNDYRVHCGVDLQASLGSDVMAVADGVVKQIYEDPFEGVCLRIGHEDGYDSVYKNLAPDLVSGLQEGSRVSGGMTVGSVGESAIIEIAEEAHLHFELYQNGVAVDPAEVLPRIEEQAHYGE